MLAQCRRVFSALVLQNMWFLIDYISRTFPVPRFSQPASSSSSAHALSAQVRVRERMGATVSLKRSLNIECASAARETDENTKWLPPSSQVCWYARKTLCIFHAVPNENEIRAKTRRQKHSCEYDDLVASAQMACQAPSTWLMRSLIW